MTKKSSVRFIRHFLLLLVIFSAGTGFAQDTFNVDIDTVKAGRFDTGRMWTFEFPPVDYFEEAYSFTPSDEWFDQVRLAALRFANGCSASFVSADGLVMTNHHCGRGYLPSVTEEGENIPTEGFYAETLEDERKVPGLFVDQLVLIEDVTDEIHTAIEGIEDRGERTQAKETKVEEIEARYADESGLEIQVVELFNGGKYSVYGYKRYNDVRLVMAPENQIGFFGGDPDNFTYPRYNLDYTFFRVYDDEGNPLQTANYFKWSPEGAEPGEAVFVVGNPGSTNRLTTVSILEFQRDYQYKYLVNLINGLVEVYQKLFDKNPENAELMNQLFGIQNAQKSYTGVLKGLHNPILMAKKRDWEEQFKEAVMEDPELKELYGGIWEEIADLQKQKEEFAGHNYAFSFSPNLFSEYFQTAKRTVTYAYQLQMPEDQRDAAYKSDMIETTKLTIFPEELNEFEENLKLKLNLDVFAEMIGADHPAVTALKGGKTGEEAVDYALEKAIVDDKDALMDLIEQGPEAILSSDDPFIQYVLKGQQEMMKLGPKMGMIMKQEDALLQELGRALFAVYGTSIPPDATFTLRIADGVVKGYDYNGTKAPAITTFFGMYDRYYSHQKEFPWNLPEKWTNPPAELDLHTPMNFVSTNDIIGGNSGSPVINKNAEVVGLAFDGNIESLPGRFIFDPSANRCVSVHSAGLLEAVQDLYEAKRISEELKNGKIVD